MDAMPMELPAVRAALLIAAPLLFTLAALVAGLSPRRPEVAWRAAGLASGLSLVAALAALLALATDGAVVMHGPSLLTLGDAGALHASVRSDVAGALMLVLVAFIGWIIVGYSRRYLDGARGQPRYLRQLMLTLAAVTLLVVTNNLAVLALAWIATSLALHGLLTFFDTRPQALIAAHKKFIASRVADACLLAGFGLLAFTLGTLEIDQAIAAAQAAPAESRGALQAAALLIVASALLKCAQLPVHGWLTQVMEAPTPVSALLHAGVVNLGGFLLIRMGPLVAEVPAAQALLVIVGSLSAVIASLVMTTRISIKVSLAWSTCAQMGFMLMQCGLGLHELALMHLLAHSLYKAHAFLGAGGAVERARLKRMTPPTPPLRFGDWLLGAAGGLALMGLAALTWGVPVAEAPALWAVGGILGLALAPLLVAPLQSQAGLRDVLAPAAAAAVAFAYFGLHALFAAALPNALPPAAPGLVGWVLALFGLLFVVQGAVRARPEGALARRLYPWLFAGLYLDELFTRLTFRVWPARVPSRRASPNCSKAAAIVNCTATMPARRAAPSARS